MATSVEAEEQRLRWLWASVKSKKYFTRRHKLRHEHERWRKIAELQRISHAARGRLEWIIFWEKNRKDVSLTARHFGIARKTFYKWLPRFEKDFLRGLEDGSRTPLRRRYREYTARQYERVFGLCPVTFTEAVWDGAGTGAGGEPETMLHGSVLGGVLRACKDIGTAH